MHAITAYRKAQSPEMSCEDLALQVGITRQALWRIEKGKTRPSHKTMAQLHKATGIPFDAFILEQP
jgi:transcriptional regulator with XRE-family HTH domain